MEITADAMAIASGLFTVAFLCTQFLSHVLTLDAIFSFTLTVYMTCYPKEFMERYFAVQPTDNLHEYLCVQTGLMVLTPALVWFLCTDPSDVTIRTTLAFSRLQMCSLSSALIYYAQSTYNLFTEEGFATVLWTNITLALVYSIHLHYNSKVNSVTRYSNLNTHLNMDMTLTFVSSALCLLSPKTAAAVFDQELNDLHVFMYRLFGAVALANSCLPWIAPKFRAASNRRAVLFSRSFCVGLALLSTIGRYRSGDVPDLFGSRLMILVLLCLFLPPFIGSMRYEQGPGWDLPWRGLRVPEMDITSPNQILKAAPTNFNALKRRTAGTNRKSQIPRRTPRLSNKPRSGRR